MYSLNPVGLHIIRLINLYIALAMEGSGLDGGTRGVGVSCSHRPERGMMREEDTKAAMSLEER